MSANYDEWLQRPYMEQFEIDDFPEYNRYLERWLKEKREEYGEHVHASIDSDVVPESFEEWIKECNYTPIDPYDYAEDLRQASYEESLRLDGYNI